MYLYRHIDTLSTSIYDLVLLYVCHFHHQFHHTFLSNHGLSRYSCLHLGSCIHEFWNNVVKKYRKKYRRPKMYWYINTFFIENVSTCRYKYILKVSDTYRVSNTKGLHGEKIQEILPALYHYWVCKQYAYYDQRCSA